MRAAAVLSLAWLTGCASTTPPIWPGPGWQMGGNAEFRAAVARLAEGATIDCGMHEMGRPLDPAVRRRVHDCVSRALRGNEAFKFGTARMPLDSFVTEVLVRSSDGKLWFLVYDWIPIEEYVTQWNATCSTASVDRKTLYVDAAQCKEHSEGPLTLP